MLDLDAIEERIGLIVDWCDYEQLDQLLDDTKALVAEVRLLQAELSAQSEMVQRDWLSPVEVAALKQKIAEVEQAVRENERQRWFDAADRVMASFYANYHNARDRQIAREVWINIRQQATHEPNLAPA